MSVTGVPPPPQEDPLWAGPPTQNLAGWGARAGAAAIDLVVRFVIATVIIGAGALAYLGGDDAGAVGLLVGSVLAVIVTWFVYAPLLMARWDGQTVGHRATNTRVVMNDGSRMSGGRAFVREALVKTLLVEAFGGLVLGIVTVLNYLWPLWDQNNEALHDKMCNTRVVITA